MKKMFSVFLSFLIVASALSASFSVAKASSFTDIITLETKSSGDNGYVEFIPVNSSGNVVDLKNIGQGNRLKNGLTNDVCQRLSSTFLVAPYFCHVKAGAFTAYGA